MQMEHRERQHWVAEIARIHTAQNAARL
jgi:hypothetical protein